MRGNAAGALLDPDLEHWQERAALAASRVAGLESLLKARVALAALSPAEAVHFMGARSSGAGQATPELASAASAYCL